MSAQALEVQESVRQVLNDIVVTIEDIWMLAADDDEFTDAFKPHTGAAAAAAVLPGPRAASASGGGASTHGDEEDEEGGRRERVCQHPSTDESAAPAAAEAVGAAPHPDAAAAASKPGATDDVVVKREVGAAAMADSNGCSRGASQLRDGDDRRPDVPHTGTVRGLYVHLVLRSRNHQEHEISWQTTIFSVRGLH